MRCLLVAALLACAGCTGIATVKPVTPRFVARQPETPEALSAEQQLSEARSYESSDPSRALGLYLASARNASEQLARTPSDKPTRDLYNFSVARTIGVIEQAHLNVWEQPLKVSMPNGSCNLTCIRNADPDRDPAQYEIIPADTLAIGGAFIKERVKADGLGAPVVAISRHARDNFRKDFTSEKLYATATGIIRFKGQKADLEFHQPFATERVSLNGRTYPLAADFTAAPAVGLTRERPEKIAIARMLRPEKYNSTARLTRLQGYDPNRIPVVFVHGLQDTPVCWVPIINALREDQEIRERYQFWVYSYPSGYPYPYAASLFRQELDGVDRAFPGHKDIVLIGHSMGGMISRLMITDVGDKMWRGVFGTPPAQTNLPEETKKLLEQTLIFNHRRDVSRVVFVCAPHRGSDMASNWIGKIGTSLIRIPFFVASIPFQAVNAAVMPTANIKPLERFPNSIDTLSPTNRFVVAINKYPITPGIPYHSIIGDRGRGDSPDSSDGVVAYWSSHLDGAKSEVIAPSNHSGTLSDPKAIAEIQRILHLHR